MTDDSTSRHVKVLENRYNAQIRISGTDGQQLTLPPLARTTVTARELEPYDLARVTNNGVVKLLYEGEPSELREAAPWLITLALMMYVISGLAIGHTWFWWAGATVLLTATALAVKGLKGGVSEAFRWAQQMLSLLGVLLVGAALPALALWYSTDLGDLQFAGGSERFFLWEVFDSPERGVVFRMVQLTFIVTVTLLPAILFYLFDRERLVTLRDRFVRTAFRLDPSLRSLDDLEASYGEQLAETYGRAEAASGGRLVGGRRLPVVVATGVLAAGWFLTVANPSIATADLTSGAVDSLDLFVPQPEVITFGFLGAYFFSLQRVLRGYLRGDLRAKTYSHIAVRVFLVVILTWIVDTVFDTGDNGYVLGAMFVMGIIPDTALKALQQFYRSRRGFFKMTGESESNLYETEPLTKLHGIDVYDWARLIDEGVTNVEALAHTDLIGLLLQTRIPTPRLINWLDQAILRIHLSDDLLKELERFGIRTATELTEIWRSDPDAFAAKLRGGTDFAARLEIVVLALEGEEWLKTVHDWRKGRDNETAVIEIAAGRGGRHLSEQ